MLNYRKLKVIALSIVLVAGMLLPVGASAQDDVVRHGGLFGYYYYGWFNSELKEVEEGGLFRAGANEDDLNCNLFNQNFSPIFGDDIAGYNLYNQSFEEVPLGSGLLILTAAGAGYALKKRKSNKNSRTLKTHIS